MSVQCARNLFAVRDSTYCPCRAEVVVIAPWLDISREGHVHIRIAPFKRIQSDRKGEAFDVQTRIPRFPVLLAFTPTKQRRKPKRTAIDFVLDLFAFPKGRAAKKRRHICGTGRVHDRLE
jgi:hypothetical protein